MSKSFAALMNLGFDNHLSSKLVAAGYTLTKLKKMTGPELEKLGLGPGLTKAIKGLPRPAIDCDVLEGLLQNARHTCCVCRNPYEPIVVHHINAWSQSKNNSEDNLIVLCSGDHARVHNTNPLAQNLTQNDLRRIKKDWEKFARSLDQAQLERLRSPHKQARWFWLNMRRLEELIRQKKISAPNTPLRNRLNEEGYLDKQGLLKSYDKWPRPAGSSYFLDFTGGGDVATYLSDLMDTALRTVPIVDISAELERPETLQNWCKVGTFVFLRSVFDFNVFERDKNFCYARAHFGKLEVVYEFDVRFSLSGTARNGHMRTENEQGVIGMFTSLTLAHGRFTLRLSALGTSPDFEPYHPTHGAWVSGPSHKTI